MSTCSLCNGALEKKNKAIYDCGHSFHLSCVFATPYSTQCSECSPSINSRPDIGLDREVASNAELLAKVSERRLKPVKTQTFIHSMMQVLTPLTPASKTFIDHMKQNKKLSIIAS